jgi:hypothetical protein
VRRSTEHVHSKPNSIARTNNHAEQTPTNRALVLHARENLFNLAFGEKLNPFYHLGTISFWQFWLLIGTGVYLYIFADTGGA